MASLTLPLPDGLPPEVVARLQREGATWLALRTAELTRNAKTPPVATVHKDWPHAPLHRLSEQGTYMVTSGTLDKTNLFDASEHRTLLENELLSVARRFGWQLEAWAVFANHYHFIAHSSGESRGLRPMLVELHSETARQLNESQGTPGRRVWFNFWDSKLTFEKSYLARLNYVHQNAVHHGLVTVANQYPWCSAAWFERTATPAQVKTIYGFKTDRLKIPDDF